MSSFLSCTVLILSIATAGAAVCQAPDSANIRSAAIVGRVVDTAGKGLADAEVILTRSSDTATLGIAKSNKRGDVVLRNLPAGGPYTILARKIGFGPARGEVQLHAGDTLYIDLELPPSAFTLAPIVVSARRNRNRITATDFKAKEYRDALGVLASRRPDMLGDPEWCSLPDSFGIQRYDRARIKLTDRLQLFSLDQNEGLRSMIARPWLEPLRYGANDFNLPALPYVRQVYVNGVRADVQGDPLRTPARVLRDIPSEQIAEMRYADCWDYSVPTGMQYTLFVVLKPRPAAVQDSIDRALLRRRAVWDSILRSLDGRRSTRP